MKDFNEAPGPGCAKCNPELLLSDEEIVAERRDEISPRMHIAKIGDGYHILQIPGLDGKPFEVGEGPFESQAAAGLYLHDLIDGFVHSYPEDLRSSRTILDHFNLAGRLLPLIEWHQGHDRSLVSALAYDRPWEKPAVENVYDPDNEIPL